jgi:UDP-2,3-diacylglucosamine pyrophosphatase LpxH
MRYLKHEVMHTIVVSDMHLSEAAARDPARPLWMAYKFVDHFIDEDFSRLLEHVDGQSDEPVELVLNGDIFDFDNVTQMPPEPEGHVNWLAKLRGLSSEEWMSRFKMARIISDHALWFRSLSRFIAAGNRAVFVIGNHDAELHWPSVQRLINEALASSDGALSDGDGVRFCSWFYISGEDTYISHGHQYDPNCSSKDPIHPFIEVHGRPRVRIPFGDLAGRYMLNGMGYFNPNATENYIMSGWQYAKFFIRYMVRTQPLLLWTWFWSAIATLVITLRDHWRPAMRDPLRVEENVAEIAESANATPSQVRKLAALSVPSSCTQPMAVIRELWLDRGFLFLAMCFLAWQVILHINIALPISPLWVFVALAVLFPPYLVYSARIKSTVFDKPLLDKRRATLIARITGAKNVVFGHTHKPHVTEIGPVRHINGGFWSAAFAEPDCKTRIGTQSFVWLRPTPSGERVARLFEWPPGAALPTAFPVPEPIEPTTRERRTSTKPESALAPEQRS